MTNKTKMSNLESYQELSIQITTLEMKIDKVLELLNSQQQWTVIHPMPSEPRIVRRTHSDFEDVSSDEEWSVEFK